MPLDGLISLLNQLRACIEQHGPLLRQSEAMTRYALIDPLLRELGWNTEDPSKVRPEYKDAGGFADYALMNGPRPTALVEAKKLGEPLASGVAQALNYCNAQGINYMIVTDGDRWEMYEVFRQARIDDRKLVSISINNEATHHSALKALYLWQPNLGSGTSVVQPPQPPAINDPAADIGSLTSSTANDSRWTPLKDFYPERGSKPPSLVRFPNGEEKPIRYWRDIWIEVAEWLIRSSALTPEKCPIIRSHSRYIVHSQPQRSLGRDFAQPHRLSTGLFIGNCSTPHLLRATC